MPKIIETTDELKILEEVGNDKYDSLESNEFDPMMAMLKTASDNTIERLTKKKAIKIRNSPLLFLLSTNNAVSRDANNAG